MPGRSRIAQQALKKVRARRGPALVEVLEAASDQRVKHIAAGISRDMGVAADASIPVCRA